MDPDPSGLDLECPACGRRDFRDEQGRGGHLATVQDDTHRAYREATGLASAQDLARLIAPAPRPYNVPRLPMPRTTTDPDREAWDDSEPRVHEPEVMPAPRPVRVLRAPPEPERRTSPLAVALGVLGAIGLAVLAFGVGRDPPTQPTPWHGK